MPRLSAALRIDRVQRCLLKVSALSQADHQVEQKIEAAPWPLSWHGRTSGLSSSKVWFRKLLGRAALLAGQPDGTDRKADLPQTFKFLCVCHGKADSRNLPLILAP